ncbi:MAG: toll/interleukin-1 receptor domain-containing protein [Lachnospiraceae bacterium]
MIFISYSSLDYVMAGHIREILQKNDISCWMEPESIPGGSDYAHEIPAAIESCDYFLLVLSKNSQDSIWVPKELDLAIDAKKMVFPIHIDLSSLKPHFKLRLSNVQCMDAAMSVEDVLDRVVQRIKDHAIEGKKHTGFPDSDDNGKDDLYLLQLNQARIFYNQKAGSQYRYVKHFSLTNSPYSYPGYILACILRMLIII